LAVIKYCGVLKDEFTVETPGFQAKNPPVYSLLTNHHINLYLTADSAVFTS